MEVYSIGLFRKKKQEPVDVISQHEACVGTMCTLAPQISQWQNWLESHGEQVKRREGKVSVGIERLAATKGNFEKLGKSVDKDKEVLSNVREEIMGITDSSTVISDPFIPDTIGVHEAAFAKIQTEHQGALDVVVQILDSKLNSMSSVEGNIGDQLDEVKSKLSRLKGVKKALDEESKVTAAFQKNIGSFIVSQISPPEK